MIPSELEKLYITKSLEKSQVELRLKTFSKQLDMFKLKREKLVHGLAESNRHLSELKDAQVVVAQEYRLVQDLQKSFQLQINKVDLEIKEAEINVSANQKMLNHYLREISNIEALCNTNNVLEFPNNELRTSQEED